MTNSKVVIVSGMGGSGKTTVVRELAKNYTNSKCLFFDDYDIDVLPSTPSLYTPIQLAVNQYDISALLEDLKMAYGSYAYLFVDFPFGYKHKSIKAIIDKVIYVKTPLDICFARRLLRDFKDETASSIKSVTEHYLNFGRPIFIDYENFVIQEADLIVDGTLAINTNIEIIKNNLL
ncbi:adenylyl-sulfate kinase [Tetragenococcus halophilus]|uniref:Adenylyl-sulfate kinase n=1 Tax=Tetragenococcus halophilus TaxID=51669 RepID=A0AB35HQN5_TETHA|nr:adenylyl-sulfate kinase [Tetragenococcus halophilus]MCO8296742.1 adenylyl-sulfate kinase [Tetragenococcus halophilus]MCO8298319.1 adenylyl-sulfate kinase [Tetragenococcus halophilus]